MSKFGSRRFLYISFLIGGIYDLILGFTLLLAFRYVLDLFNMQIPTPYIFVQVCGLFLIAIGYFLIFASQKPEEYVFLGIGSCFVRFTYGIIILIALLNDEIALLYILVGVTDFLTGCLILIALITSRDVILTDLWKIN